MRSKLQACILCIFPGHKRQSIQRRRIREQDAKEETWLGKTYNGYERTQKARQYESTMRQQRSYIQALNEGGADPADIQAVQTRYLTTMNEYKGFCAQMDMRPDMQRVYIDGLGRMSGGRIATVTNSKIKLASGKLTKRSLKYISEGKAELNEHRKAILKTVPNSGDWHYTEKGKVTLKDLAYLSAHEHHEFALWESKNKEI